MSLPTAWGLFGILKYLLWHFYHFHSERYMIKMVSPSKLEDQILVVRLTVWLQKLYFLGLKKIDFLRHLQQGEFHLARMQRKKAWFDFPKNIFVICNCMLIYENRPSKIKFFWSQGLFSGILISKIGVKMNLRIITKNHAADPEIGFLTKSTQSRIPAHRPCRQRGS